MIDPQQTPFLDSPDYHVDEKGKYYTKRVSKRSVAVLASTNGTLIKGAMHLMLDNRVKDELNQGERFIAITGATVTESATGRTLLSGGTVLLNRERVNWIVPLDESPHQEESHVDHGG